MADETNTETHESAGADGGHAAGADLSGITPEQLAEAAKELFADAPHLQQHLDELVKISQEKDEQKREALLEALQQRDAAAFEGEVPEPPDVADDEPEEAEPHAAGAPEDGGLPPPPGAARRASQRDITAQACLVAAGGLGVVVGLFGLRVPAKKLAAALQKKTKPAQWRYGIITASKEIAAAKRVGDRMRLARAYWSIVSGLLRVTSVKSIVQIMFGSMTLKDWIKSGAIVLAQLTVWFGTQGMAFIAQVALTALDAASLIEDSIKLSTMV